jgi:hypothetical protein
LHNEELHNFHSSRNLISMIKQKTMLGGSLVATAWRVLRLRLEETTSRYGAKLRIRLISRRGQPKRGDPPAWSFGVGLTTPRRKNKLVTKGHKKPRNWTKKDKVAGD